MAFVIAAGIGLSRIYLGAHWASDVIAGWAVGGICLSAAVIAHRAVGNHHRRKIIIEPDVVGSRRP